ncbi:MAG: cobalt ECF transporter T component CbiQ [Oligoflexia bacterium]|nr:cobalt ECF transporter T component CbiQ [Oligoflexia bacterium]
MSILNNSIIELNNQDRLVYSNKLRFIHPAEKFLFVFQCMTFSLLADSYFVPLMVAILVTMTALLIAKIKLKRWLLMLAIPTLFALLSVVLLIVTLTFEPKTNNTLYPYLWMSIGISHSGIVTAVHALSRFLACTTSLFFLLATTPITDIISMLRYLRLPSILLELLIFCYRSIFILLNTCMQMKNAQSSRLGYCDMRSSYRSFILLISGLFARSISRAHQSSMAMVSRGYENEVRVLTANYNKLSVTNLLINLMVGCVLILFSVLSSGRMFSFGIGKI